METKPVDTRYVYGARCTWHGPISAVNVIPHSGAGGGLPVCPHCSGPLYEFPSVMSWDNMVATYNAKHPGYTEFVEWLGSYGRCWPNPVVAQRQYEALTGKKVQLGT